MGGKRPDQYRLDPAEGGATDYKSRRHEGDLSVEEKQKLAQGQADSRIPRRGRNPALQELDEQRAQAARARDHERDEVERELARDQERNADDTRDPDA